MNIIGQEKGLLTVIEQAESKFGKAHWIAQCNCGGVTIPFSTSEWNSGKRTNCGCRGSSIGPVSLGDKFYNWTVVGFITKAYYECKCACGNLSKVRRCDLAHGKSRQCAECSVKDKVIFDFGSSKRSIIGTYRKNAKNSNRVWELTNEEALSFFAGNCHYCDREPQMAHTASINSGTYWYNGIDRVDNDLGYTIDNCVSCCWACNAAKRGMPVEDFIYWLDAIAKFRSKA